MPFDDNGIVQLSLWLFENQYRRAATPVGFLTAIILWDFSRKQRQLEMTYQDLHSISLSTSGTQTKNHLLELMEILQKGIGLHMHAYVLQVKWFPSFLKASAVAIH